MKGKGAVCDEEVYLIATELLKGSYDLHIHSSPSHLNRCVDDYQALDEAAAAGMAGIALKNHYESTVRCVELLNTRKTVDTKVYGGIVLNKPAGGLNPYAVESALRLGGKFVWMPTRDAANEFRCKRYPEGFLDRKGGVRVLDESGNVYPELYEILNLCKEFGAVFGTGHISPEESIKICKVARRMGVKTVLTHPEWSYTSVPGNIQAELAALGVKIEKLWFNIEACDTTIENMIENIRLCGVENCFLSTDRGQINKMHPVDAIRLFIMQLLKHGFSKEEIKAMTKQVPGELVA